MNGGADIASFNQRLQAAIHSRQSFLCVGLDPDIRRLPSSVSRDHPGIEAFLRTIVDATAEHVAAFKPNLAFFLSLGSWGFDLLSSLRERIPPEIILIGDAKWGDIGNTAERYAASAFDVLGFDAVTVNPYQGSDSARPFLQLESHGAFVLCKTSNPSAREFQESGAGEPLYAEVARAASDWNSLGNCGLVIGADEVEALALARRDTPSLSLLIPGVGAQAGDLAACLAEVGGSHPATFVINASRSVLYAGEAGSYWKSSTAEAKRLRGLINAGL
ncbi:MAG: orotidine-5'-phosphate decarboxylase [Chloroflexi bacterium]|nr:orotidine-5'-phosphate decarboxylase [Chloroflexota bacterium]MCY3937520.1 orotidine-5'-phosphate decarboxylase [Chloroflexota bacterium]